MFRLYSLLSKPPFELRLYYSYVSWKHGFVFVSTSGKGVPSHWLFLQEFLTLRTFLILLQSCIEIKNNCKNYWWEFKLIIIPLYKIRLKITWVFHLLLEWPEFEAVQPSENIRKHYTIKNIFMIVLCLYFKLKFPSRESNYTEFPNLSHLWQQAFKFFQVQRRPAVGSTAVGSTT